MMSDLAWPLATVGSWFIMYFVFIKPMLDKIHTTMGTSKTIASPLVPWWKKALTRLEGSKTVIASFVISLFSAGKTAIDALAQNTGIIDEVKNGPWASFLTPDMALKVVGVCMFLITGLHLWGVLKAAKTPPQG